MAGPLQKPSIGQTVFMPAIRKLPSAKNTGDIEKGPLPVAARSLRQTISHTLQEESLLLSDGLRQGFEFVDVQSPVLIRVIFLKNGRDAWKVFAQQRCH
jgi:hypothetical protein